MTKHNQSGFSLTELIVVVAIIAILAAVAVPIITKNRAQASRSEVVPCITEISLQLENYRSNHGVYPPADDPWAAIDSSATCGDHYTGHIEILDNRTRYIVAFRDGTEAIYSDGGEDAWAITDVSSKIHQVTNPVNGKTETLPTDGDFTYSMPSF